MEETRPRTGAPKGTSSQPRALSVRSGQAVIEFLVVLIPLLTIVYMGIEFALAIFAKQMSAQAAHIAGREAATEPGSISFPGDAREVFNDNAVFNEYLTAIDLAQVPDLDALFASAPPAHQVLRPLMYTETRTDIGGTRTILRLPGVLLYNPGGNRRRHEDLIVRVPTSISGGTATLGRVIDPPLSGDPLYTKSGLMTFKANYWYQFNVWMLGGSPPVITGVDPNTVPPGFTAVDFGTSKPNAVFMQSRSVSRKEVR